MKEARPWKGSGRVVPGPAASQCVPPRRILGTTPRAGHRDAPGSRFSGESDCTRHSRPATPGCTVKVIAAAVDAKAISCSSASAIAAPTRTRHSALCSILITDRPSQRGKETLGDATGAEGTCRTTTKMTQVSERSSASAWDAGTSYKSQICALVCGVRARLLVNIVHVLARQRAPHLAPAARSLPPAAHLCVRARSRAARGARWRGGVCAGLSGARVQHPLVSQPGAFRALARRGRVRSVWAAQQLRVG